MVQETDQQFYMAHLQLQVKFTQIQCSLHELLQIHEMLRKFHTQSREHHNAARSEITRII